MSNKVYKSFSTYNDKRTSAGKLYDIEVVKQDILSMVHTRKGDYPMDLNRGFIIHDFLFSPSLNDTETNLIEEDARAQLGEDPRFSILGVNVFSDDTASIILYLSLRVLPFNSEINLTIDFKD